MSSIAFQPSLASQSGLRAADSTTSTSSSSSTSSDQTSIAALGGTFLNLLTQELQNQDPTAPMDSTEMVGQMISLNQLDQLASINQLLTSTLGSSNSSTTGTASATGNSSVAHAPAAQATLPTPLDPLQLGTAQANAAASITSPSF